MSAPDLNRCACCDSRLAPRLTDSTKGVGLFSLGVWVECPSCMMAGPRTWICFESAEVEAELVEAQAEAARAWNRIHAAVSGMADMAEALTGSERFPSLRGRAV